MYFSKTVWEDRNHVFGLPVGMSKYALTKHRLHLEQGFFVRTFDEVNLRYVQGISITRNIAQRMTGCGTVTVRLNHRNHKEFVFKNVKYPMEVAELIHEYSMDVQGKHLDRVRRYYLNHPFEAAEMLRNNPELANDEYHERFVHLCEHYL